MPDHDFRLQSGWQETGGASVTLITGLHVDGGIAVQLMWSSTDIVFANLLMGCLVVVCGRRRQVSIFALVDLLLQPVKQFLALAAL